PTRGRPADGARGMTVRRSRPLRFAAALVATNLRQSLALRGAFWLQAAFMLANNLIFFTTWWIFFRRFQDVGGWRLEDLATLFGVVAAGFGLCVVFTGGIRELARAITDGDLDSLLLQPKPVLLQAAAARSLASGWEISPRASDCSGSSARFARRRSRGPRSRWCRARASSSPAGSSSTARRSGSDASSTWRDRYGNSRSPSASIRDRCSPAGSRCCSTR